MKIIEFEIYLLKNGLLYPQHILLILIWCVAFILAVKNKKIQDFFIHFLLCVALFTAYMIFLTKPSINSQNQDNYLLGYIFGYTLIALPTVFFYGIGFIAYLIFWKKIMRRKENVIDN
jgi:hypothetical protein